MHVLKFKWKTTLRGQNQKIPSKISNEPLQAILGVKYQTYMDEQPHNIQGIQKRANVEKWDFEWAMKMDKAMGQLMFCGK